MVGALVLTLCSVPLLGSVAWIRGCAADATIDAQVAAALDEQMSLVRSLGRASSLAAGTVASNKNLGNGVTLTIARTIAPIAGKPRLYDVTAVASWTSRGGGGKARSMTLETYVFAPDN